MNAYAFYTDNHNLIANKEEDLAFMTRKLKEEFENWNWQSSKYVHVLNNWTLSCGQQVYDWKQKFVYTDVLWNQLQHMGLNAGK